MPPIPSGRRQLRRTQVKLPKLSKGKHVITAVYAGSDATEESRSKPLKLKVRPRR